MKINKKLGIFVSSLLCTTALSASGHVSMSADGTGDFLIAPFYEAKNDVCSEIKVFNMNDHSSVLAKVAFREQKSSQEFDLPIFLTPGDTWSATLCSNYGNVVIQSSDDSNHPKIKDVLKRGKDLTKHSKAVGQDDANFERGYVEVYPIAQFDEVSKDISKELLVKRWNDLSNAQLNDRRLRREGVANNSLSGMVSYQTNVRETATIPMVAFKDAHTAQKIGTAISYEYPAKPELLLGENKKQDILKLLQNGSLSFTFDRYGHEQFLYIAFPFGYTADQERSFKLVIRDMSSNKDVQETVIFSPSPVKTKYVVNNELAVIPINKFVNLTSDYKKFKKGLIQLKEITNLGDHQLGMGKHASFIPTVVSTRESREKYISTVTKAPVRK